MPDLGTVASLGATGQLTGGVAITPSDIEGMLDDPATLEPYLRQAAIQGATGAATAFCGPACGAVAGALAGPVYDTVVGGIKDFLGGGKDYTYLYDRREHAHAKADQMAELGRSLGFSANDFRGSPYWSTDFDAGDWFWNHLPGVRTAGQAPPQATTDQIFERDAKALAGLGAIRRAQTIEQLNAYYQNAFAGFGAALEEQINQARTAAEQFEAQRAAWQALAYGVELVRAGMAKQHPGFIASTAFAARVLTGNSSAQKTLEIAQRLPGARTPFAIRLYQRSIG
jgi:hypothetical protein